MFPHKTVDYIKKNYHSFRFIFIFIVSSAIVLSLYILSSPSQVPLNTQNAQAQTPTYGGYPPHYLNFYQIRYASGIGDPLPTGLVEFIIGGGFGGLKRYVYVSYHQIHGHVSIDRREASRDAVALSEAEIDALFGGASLLRKDKLQKADINKIHAQLLPSNPPLKYGVQLDTNGDPIFDGAGDPVPDSPTADYQNGKTIVYPVLYGSYARFYFNFNTPAVKEYAIRLNLKTQSLGPDAALFQDDMSWGDELFTFYSYISSGTTTQKMQTVANQISDINKQVKARIDPAGRTNTGILMNNMRAQDYYSLFANFSFDEFIKPTNLSSFDGMMFENYFYDDNLVTDVQYYLDKGSALNSNGKMALFVASQDTRLTNPNSVFVEDLWYWLHLVANPRTYVYINDQYHEPMIDYAVYRSPLGLPLGAVRRDGNIWKRTYETGEIIFDISSRRLDTIQFIPSTTPPPPSAQPNYITQGLATAPGGLTAGQLVTFAATIKNSGTGNATVSSSTRLRLDIGNNGTYDQTFINQTTSPLLAGATEVENWTNVWTATAGTHRFEVCSDITNLITESNETDNCTTQLFTVTAPSTPDYGGYRPHYQGLGATSQGGRGGLVCIVNNLNNFGPGSLRDCVERSGPRYVIFEVSGTIVDDIIISNPYITIAGQTAPSPGITLSGSLTADTNDIVLQHFRVRGRSWGTSPFYVGVADTGSNTNVYNVVMDHLSVSWGHGVTTWNLSPGGAHDVLLVDSIVSEGLSIDYSYPNCGGTAGVTANCSGIGALFYADPECSATVVRNAFIHNGNRNPWFSAGCQAEAYNNLAYNAETDVGDDGVGGFMQVVSVGPNYPVSPVDLVYMGNVNIPGPDTVGPDGTIGIHIDQAYRAGNRLYLADNTGPGIIGATGNGQWAGVDYGYGATEGIIRSDTLPSWFNARGILPSPSVQSFVLANAGARPLDRDSVDARVLQDVTQGDGTNHIPNINAVGGLPILAKNFRSLTIPANPNAIALGETFRTNIEVWLEAYACALEPACASAPIPPPQPPPPNGSTGQNPPQILSVDPNTVKPGDKIEIIGVFLDLNVTLLNLSNGSTITLTADLNSQKTLATITLPSDIPIGNYTLTMAGDSGTTTFSKTLTLQSTTQTTAQNTLPQLPPAQDLGNLIKSIFSWALALVGIAVFVNFLWAGILWFTAAGRPGPIKEAKGKMFNSLIGAIILLASYLILNTINPDLVQQTFTLPGIK